MVDLTRTWPLGLGEKRWWMAFLAALVALALALTFDGQLSRWAQSWPEAIRGALVQITPYGESDWILYPSAALFAITAVVALFVRWKLMRTLLWQFAALYGFIFIGVGLPSLIAALVKRVIGRARPQYLDEVGTLGFRWNWLDWTYQSFPSGHATTAFALATVIGFISPRWFYPGVAMAALIALSRVSMGVHYPSDIVAGAILGLLGAYFTRWLFAKRGWMFASDRAGRTVTRPMSSLKRYLTLRRRRTVRAQLPNRP